MRGSPLAHRHRHGGGVVAFAGSNPVAGGTVGFPVLVYLFDHTARLGQQLDLAIRSIGMVSASIYILTHRRRVEWRILRVHRRWWGRPWGCRSV